MFHSLGMIYCGMARPLRIEYEGAVYHAISRDNGGEAIFLSDDERKMFLEVLVHVVERFGWICHALCRMDNHYHLLIQTPQVNLKGKADARNKSRLSQKASMSVLGAWMDMDEGVGVVLT